MAYYKTEARGKGKDLFGVEYTLSIGRNRVFFITPALFVRGGLQIAIRGGSRSFCPNGYRQVSALKRGL